MRADETIKKDIYRDAIMKDFIKKGVYPSLELLEQELSGIDLLESFFKTVPVVAGELFNTNVYNAQLDALEKDLALLYHLIDVYINKERNSLSQFADTTLTELEKKADFYLAKSKLEMQSSDLGKTVLFMRTPFTGEQLNEYFSIDCGEVELTNASNIHLIVEGNNIHYARLKLASNDQTFYMTPYHMNMQHFTVPGDMLQEEITVEVSSAPASNESIVLPYIPKEQCDYLILTGENHLSAKTSSKAVYGNYNSYACYEDTMIDFYVKDASSIQIRTNIRPLSSNYDNSKDVILLEKGIHHFYLHMPANSTIEIFIEGGKVFAQKSKGIVKSELLYMIHGASFKEFLIIEKSRANKTAYRATLEVRSTAEALGIESVMIKEMI